MVCFVVFFVIVYACSKIDSRFSEKQTKAKVRSKSSNAVIYVALAYSLACIVMNIARNGNSAFEFEIGRAAKRREQVAISLEPKLDPSQQAVQLRAYTAFVGFFMLFGARFCVRRLREANDGLLNASTG